MDKKTKLMTKLKEVNQVYQKSSNSKRIRIAEACEPLLEELETLGVSRVDSEMLMMFGGEYISYQKGLLVKDEVIKQEVTTDDIEKIFKADVEDLTGSELEAFKVAKKNKVASYQILPRNGKKVKIGVHGYWS